MSLASHANRGCEADDGGMVLEVTMVVVTVTTVQDLFKAYAPAGAHQNP